MLFVWVCTGVYVGVYGVLSVFRCLCVSMSVDGCLWICMGVHGCLGF